MCTLVFIVDYFIITLQAFKKISDICCLGCATLRTEDSSLSPEDARDKIEQDCIEIWSKRTILDALPDEAKDRKKQKSGRLSQKEHVSAAFSAARESPKSKERDCD
jgi:hypothetical protein